MALNGDFQTFPLPDLLQWLEGSRKRGRLTITSGGGERVFLLSPEGISRYGAAGLYERLARLLRLVKALDETGGRLAVEAARGGARCEEAFAAAGVPESLLREVSRDDAMQSATDLFEDAGASFNFSDETDDEGDETTRVDLSLRELLYEAARRHDEAGPAVERIGSDSTFLRPGTSHAERPPRGLSAAALGALGQGATVGAVRLDLGLSRSGAARILFELWREGRVRIDGADAPQPDPLTRVLEQGEQLLAAGHFEAAALVFESLLAADPSDRRVREFARAVEREHVDALYRKLSPVAVPRMLATEASLATVRQDERIVAALLNDRWDVSTVVLASPLRELQTLRALVRMVELGLIALRTQ
ncbi:MAG: DUF4388 domain-containing protein [Deltaproteobacteria bacterium]|nr:DUF4388 domain-containing protein [Deltaproteobacteria bacterium]